MAGTGARALPKKTTDLLDVFRHRPVEGGSSGRPSKRRASRSKDRAFEGVFLAPRQLLFVSAIGVLLLALSFTVGLGFGRHGAERPTLEKTTSGSWWILGRMGGTDPAGRPLDPDQVKAELVRVHGLPAQNLRVETTSEGGLVVYLGPWTEKAPAEEYLRIHHLDASVLLRGSAPFSHAKVVSRGR